MADDSPETDWESIERLYRAGTLSVRAIARAHRVSDVGILKRAKRFEWTRNLAGKVHNALQTRLVSTGVRNLSPEDEAAMVEQAAQEGVRVVLEHRANTGRMRQVALLLLERLHDAIEGDQAIRDLIAQEPDGITKMRLRAAIALPEQAKVLDKIAAAFAKIVPLERQAFCIDQEPEAAPTTNPAQERLKSEAYGVVMGMLAERARAKHEEPLTIEQEAP